LSLKPLETRKKKQEEQIQKMAVPGRRNGMIDDDENEDNALFEEEGLIERDSDTPPHLRELAAASELGNLDALRLALDNLTGSIDEPVEDGDTALHLTCLYGHLSCVRLLLERGANIEVEDEDGAIPLHDACAESVDAEGDTPLHHAARGEHAGVIRLLVSSGASLTQPNTCGKTPIELVEPGTEARSILEAAAGPAACELALPNTR
jgi:ankyrin repeat protein